MPAEAPRRARGFTLVELLVVLAISSITILTAAMVFAAMLNQRRLGERTIEVYASLAMAQGVMEYDLSNAGWRFPSPALAVRVINNVDSSTSIPDTGLTAHNNFITLNANCGPSSWGLVPGSDVLEVAEGYAAESNGVVLAADTTGFTIKGSASPFTTVAVGDKPLVLFASHQGDVYLGRAAGAADSINRVAFDTNGVLNTDYTDASPSPYSVSPPVAGMNVYRLGRRTRYLLCRDTAAGSAARPVLYRQQSGDNGDLSANGFQSIQDGIADLQLGVRVGDPTTTHLTGGSDCVPAGGGQFCYCNVTGPCGGTDVAGNSPSAFFTGAVLAHTGQGSADQWVRMVLLGLTGMSTRPAAVGATAGNPAYLRPRLLDHAAATGTGDGNLYLTQQRVLSLRNLTQVIP